jgi:L-amino acid N-acyltransferase YncA
MIRLARLDDGVAVAEIYRPYVESTVISFEVVAPSADEMGARIRDTLGRFPWLVCEEDGGVAGYAYASAHQTRAAYQWSVNAAVYVNRDSHRQGVGRRLYAALFPLLARQGFVNAYAGITLPNAKSVGLHEAMGFTLVGVYRNVGYKMGAWHDVGWWSLPLQSLPASPQLPVALPDMTDLGMPHG